MCSKRWTIWARCPHKRKTQQPCDAYKAEARKFKYTWLSCIFEPRCPEGTYTYVMRKDDKCSSCMRDDRIQQWERDVDEAYAMDAIVRDEEPRFRGCDMLPQALEPRRYLSPLPRRTEDVPVAPEGSTTLPAPKRFSWLDRKPLPPVPKRPFTEPLRANGVCKEERRSAPVRTQAGTAHADGVGMSLEEQIDEVELMWQRACK